MKPYYQDSLVTQYCGHAIDTLSGLEPEIAQACVTSPPYWGLRKYAGEQEFNWNGWRGAYGLEPNPELYVAHTIEILRAIRRVLRKDGVVFLNLGDSYAAGGGTQVVQTKNASHGLAGYRQKTPTVKPKDLCLIPFRVAIAAQEDGWWVRSVIIWSKSNPMPESVKDRPTESHEYILMLTRSKDYYWDIEAVREPINPNNTGKVAVRPSGDSKTRDKEHWGVPHERQEVIREYGQICGRNLRSVWEINTQPFSGAHFAVFPEKIPERCILAATSEKGNCSKCGKPWVRIVKRHETLPVKDYEGKCSTLDEQHGSRRIQGNVRAWREAGGDHDNPFPPPETLGWQPTCSCEAPSEPALCLDPFSGSGTTLWVAKRLGRRGIGIDTSSAYCDLAIERNRQQAMMMAL